MPGNGYPEFKHSFIFYQPHSHNDSEPVEIVDGVCQRVTEKRLRDCIIGHYNTYLLDEFCDEALSYSATQDLYECVRAGVPVVSEIEPVGFADDAGYFWHRLDFNRPTTTVDPKEVCPFYYEFYYQRFDPANRDSAMAFNGSLFVPGSDRSQALILVGPGGQGKGRHMYLYDRLLGKGQGAVDVALPRGGQNENTEQEKFVSECADARLAMAEDRGQTHFFNSAFFRQITGNPNHRGRKLHKDAANYHLKVKIVCDSNHDPILEDNPETLRRIIYTGIKEIDFDQTGRIPQRELDETLWSEREGIVAFWLQTYRQLCPGGDEVIPCDTDRVRAIASTFFEDFEEFASRFVFGPDLYCVAGDVKEMRRQVFGNRGASSLKLTSRLREYLQRNHGAGQLCQRKVGGQNKKVWAGMALASTRADEHQF